jgi:hypothetical protein
VVWMCVCMFAVLGIEPRLLHQASLNFLNQASGLSVGSLRFDTIWTFLCEINYRSFDFIVIDLLRFFMCSYFNFDRSYGSRNLFTFSRFSVCWHIVFPMGFSGMCCNTSFFASDFIDL